MYVLYGVLCAITTLSPTPKPALLDLRGVVQPSMTRSHLPLGAYLEEVKRNSKIRARLKYLTAAFESRYQIASVQSLWPKRRQSLGHRQALGRLMSFFRVLFHHSPPS